jgi:hypothetical protein
MGEGEMPKEIIESTGPVVGSNNTLSAVSMAMSVAWGREGGHVQVGTYNPLVLDQHSPEAGWYIDLDRAAINRLIRVLRRARDQALGRDE